MGNTYNSTTTEQLICTSIMQTFNDDIKNFSSKDVALGMIMSKIIQERGTDQEVKKLLEKEKLSIEDIQKVMLDATKGTKDNPIVLNATSSSTKLFCINCGKFGHEEPLCKRFCSICNVKSHNLTYCRKNKEGIWKKSSFNKDSLN